MTLIIALGFVAVVGVIGAWVWGSRGRDDRSMKTHKVTVGTIERIVGRRDVEAGDAANHVRLVGDRPRHSRGDHVAGKRPAGRPPATVQQAAKTRQPADPPRQAPVPPSLVPLVEDSEPSDEGAPTRRAVHARSQGRVGALVPAAAGAVVVVTAVVVALTVASPSSKPGSPPAASSTGRTPQGPAGGVPLTSAPPTSAPASTTTAVGAVTQTASGYQYQVAGTEVSAVLSASGPCWLEVRGGSASGPALFEATLTSGSTKSFSSPGGLWLRLGAPRSVRLSLQGHDVALPGVGGPYNITVITLPPG